MDGFYDQGALLRSGAALVPDFAGQDLQRQQLGIQQQAAQADLMRAQQTGLAARNTIDRQGAYQAWVQQHPNPTIAQLNEGMIQFPEFREALSKAAETMDTQARRTDFQDASETYSAILNGRPESAAAILQRRVDADRAGGRDPDPQDTQILAMLNSGDPEQIRVAGQFARRHAAILGGPEHMSQVFAIDNPDVGVLSPGQVAYDQRTGALLGQSPVQQVIANPNGGGVALGLQPGVGIVGGGSAPVAPLVPEPTAPVAPASPVVSASIPTPARGRAGGVASNGFRIGQGYGASRGSNGRGVHMGLDMSAPEGTPFRAGQAYTVLGGPDRPHRQGAIRNGRDGGNIATIQFADGTQWKAMHLPDLPQPGNYAADSGVLRSGRSGIRNSGAHIHWQPANPAARQIYARGPQATAAYLSGGGGQQQAGPVRVRSQQQYARLASGTEFIGPDGQHRRKP